MSAKETNGTTHHLSSAIDSLEQEEADALRRVDETKERVKRAQADHDAAVQWADSIRQAMKTIREVTAHAKPPRPTTLPDRIVFTLRRAGKPLRVGEIVERMIEGGWETKSADAVATARVAVSRLLSSGVIVRAAHGQYAPPEITDAPAEAEASEQRNQEGGSNNAAAIND